MTKRGGARPGAGNKPGSRRRTNDEVLRSRHITVNDVMWQEIHSQAEVDGVSASEWIRNAIRKELTKISY